jgi:Cyclin, N-terminal domain
MVDLLERIDTLLQQESFFYQTNDYLNPDYQQKLILSYDSDNDDPSVQSSNLSASSYSSASSGINEIWREKICEWSYQVIDHFDFSREVVSVSIHYLDRFLSTRPVNKKKFQLAAMTTLYLAIKLYEPGTLSMASMIELSRGYFMVEQMAEMEMAILR